MDSAPALDVNAKLTELQIRWPRLTNDVARGEAIRAVHRAGVSFRTLAEKLGCSATELRYLCQAAEAPVQDRYLARAGKISTRELASRSKRAREQEKIKKEEDLDLKRTKEAEAGATTIRKWLRLENIGYATGERIVTEAHSILHAAKEHGTLPKGVPPPRGTPIDVIIQQCRPKQGEQDVFFVANDARWLAVSTFYAFPDELVRERALNLAADREATWDKK